MARRYRYGALRRLLNRFAAAAVRRGRGPGSVRLLTVAGRRTGEPHTTPVHVMAAEGGRWLVAPYGAVGWVRNLRTAGRGTLERGAHREDVGAVEVGPEEAAPVLQRYIADVPITRPYFDVSADSALDAIAAEAGRHPVFRLIPPGGGG
ncbi:MAG TPA: nitroreductase family deazaflavin-dependent oxidoreductase [Miltoncostaeaceae bacterium]|nr:nitroreductase family deazaflavin-dependent oxidoreductase [Miltoncostaeaceae bacterium]